MAGRHAHARQRPSPQSEAQAAGLSKLLDLARPDPGDRAGWSRRPGRGSSGLRASAERVPGALRADYDIPEVSFRRNEARGLTLTAMLVAGWISWHLGWHSLLLVLCVAPAAGFRAASYLLSWLDKPVKVRLRAQAALDRLHVAIAVPVYNEDAGLLDRCLYAMMNQTRPPQLIWIVDDGSKTDYSALRQYWAGWWPNGTEVRWTVQQNQGKRRAHAVVFGSVPEADIFVTVDSDTTLDPRALEEGLKPFQDARVRSVAGIEMGFNAHANFLTRLQCSLQLFAQAVIGAAWSVAGDMYTNRGPFALYAAPMVREFLPVYRDETFAGRRVILGDDSLLALCASARGRSVQQLSAFGLTMWPEKLGHHLRQRLRWARGRTVRNFWRVKYRPFRSYCWWFTVSGIHGFLVSTAVLVLLACNWPGSEPIVMRALAVVLIMSVPNALRTLCFRRSDETWSDRALLILIRPLSAIWSAVVLARVIRVWGTCTFMKQGWTTRQQGAELTLEPQVTAGFAAARPAAASSASASSAAAGRAVPAEEAAA